MLMRFGVANHLSIKAYQEFSMMASSLKDPGSYLLQGVDKPVLPIGVIYGANASGKSNILQAWSFFCHTILASNTTSSNRKTTGQRPFLLDPEMTNSPSRFDCDIIIRGKRHHYGFIINNERVMEEWLYVYPEHRRQVWFHRNHEENSEYFFGPHLKGRKQVLSEFTAPNSLFLSTAATNQHEQLSPIRNYFRDSQRHLFSTVPSNALQPLPRGDIENDERRQRIVNLLAEGDTGVIDIKVEDIFTGGFFIEILKLGHRGKSGQTFFLDLQNESLGTRSLLEIQGPVFDALDRGGVLWIDELSANMHPLLASRIVALFGSQEANPNGAQLVCTTHNTHLLNEGLLRRDQIWFTEKDSEGATELYPLADYHIRGGENFERDYLQGRYGAIPYLGSLERLFGRTSTISSPSVGESTQSTRRRAS
ncbi:MAG: ATP-binding protein [Magnetococcales bacterium]|nr:ATP-binding protein [Magnetococcales bacterium]